MGLTEWDNRLLDKYARFYIALHEGALRPKTELQERFLRVCRGEKAPRTQHEIAFSRYLHGRSRSPRWRISAPGEGEARRRKAVDIVDTVLVKDEAGSPDVTTDRSLGFFERVRSDYQKGVLTAKRASADVAAWISTLHAIPEIESSVTNWASDRWGDLSNIYTKAMDGSWLHDMGGISPIEHRILVPGHLPGEAWRAVKDALPDDSIWDEMIGFSSAYLSDLVTSAGMPIVNLSRESFDDLKEFLGETLGFSQAEVVDLLTVNAVEVVSGIVPIIAAALMWSEPESKAFARMIGALGIGSAVALNPALAIVNLVLLARCYHAAVRKGEAGRATVDIASGALRYGAILGAVSVVGMPVLLGGAGAGIAAAYFLSRASRQVGDDILGNVTDSARNFAKATGDLLSRKLGVAF